MTNGAGRLKRAAMIAEVIGGTAVLISVIYLALQISDNNRLLHSQSHYNALEVLQRPFEIMLQSDSLANTLYQCDINPYEISDSLWSQCVNYYFMQVNGWEYTYYQHLDKSVPSSLWAGVEGYFENEVRTKAGYVRFWEETALGFGEPFRSYIDERIRRNASYPKSSD